MILAQANDMSLPAPTPTPAVPVTKSEVRPPPKPQQPSMAPGSIAGEALVLAILLGLAASGIVAAVRKKFRDAGGKLGELLACDLCVSFWMSAALTAIWWYGTGLPFVMATALFFGSTWFAALGVSLIAVRAYGRLADAFSGVTTPPGA